MNSFLMKSQTREEVNTIFSRLYSKRKMALMSVNTRFNTQILIVLLLYNLIIILEDYFHQCTKQVKGVHQYCYTIQQKIIKLFQYVNFRLHSTMITYI